MPSRNNNYRFISCMNPRIILLILVWVTMTSCATIESDFQKAQQVDSTEAYRKFIREHSKSQLARKAKDRIMELEFEGAVVIGTREAYKEFTKKHVWGKYYRQASDKIEQIDFERVNHSGNIKSLNTFIQTYPRSRFVEQAEAQVREIRYEKYKKEDSLGGYQLFLQWYPQGRFVNEIKNRLKEIHKKEFDKVEAINTVDAYQKFLSDYQNAGLYAKEAKSHIEKIEYDTAVESSDEKILISFVKSYPKSKYRVEILQRYAEIQNGFSKKVSNGNTTIIVILWRTSSPEDAPGSTTYVMGSGGVWIPRSIAPGISIAGEILVARSEQRSVKIGFPRIYESNGNKTDASTEFNDRTNRFVTFLAGTYKNQVLQLILKDRNKSFPAIKFEVSQLPYR